jgi:hypothetical protein
MAVLAAQDDSALATKKVTSFLDLTLATNPIRNGSLVEVMMDTISGAGVASIPTRLYLRS